MGNLSMRVVVAGLAILLFACTSPAPQITQSNVAVLPDRPAVEFSTGGWSYSNTLNPFLLTPDYLTNAMIAVSRLQPGEPLLNGGPIISAPITIDSVRDAVATRTRNKETLTLRTEEIAGRMVVHATYSDGEERREEYAFPLNGYLVHVLLVAKAGNYYKTGSKIAREVVVTFKVR